MRRYRNEAAIEIFLFREPCIVFDVGGTDHLAAKLREILPPADIGQLVHAGEFLAHRDEIDGLPLLVELHHRLVDDLVALFVKDFSSAFPERLYDRFYCISLEQNACKHFLLDFGGVGRNPAFPRKVYIGTEIDRGLGCAGGRVFHESCLRPDCPHKLVFRYHGIPFCPGNILH